MSLPYRERGLKSGRRSGNCDILRVAPLQGAWIEIFSELSEKAKRKVAPLQGAWIEIFRLDDIIRAVKVAPLQGAWIEINK